MSPSFNQLIDISRTGIMSRMMDLDNVSNNLANVTTTGFKQSRINFQELLQKLQLAGVDATASQLSMEQGALEVTSNSLDMAIEGEGFFAVKLQDGKTAYTRDGSFSMDASGQIVNGDGHPLVWSGTLPANVEAVEVTTAGEVRVKVGDAWSMAGTVNLYTFNNPSGLTSQGNNLWFESTISGAVRSGTADTTGFGKIHGYALERSNVNIASEIAHMVRLQRSYDMAVRALQKTDQMISQAIHMR